MALVAGLHNIELCVVRTFELNRETLGEEVELLHYLKVTLELVDVGRDGTTAVVHHVRETMRTGSGKCETVGVVGGCGNHLAVYDTGLENGVAAYMRRITPDEPSEPMLGLSALDTLPAMLNDTVVDDVTSRSRLAR